MKLAIVGARKFTDYELFKEKVDQFLEEWGELIECIVSGGATGTDTMAEKYAKEHGYKTIIHYPQWDKYGRAAGPMRNTLIVEDATHVIAFPAVGGHGTQDTMKKTKKTNKPMKVFWFDKPKNSKN